MSGVRGHEPTCPIARETWCIWDGAKCDWCSAYRKGFDAGQKRAIAALVAASTALADGLVTAIDADLAEHAAELEFASLHEEGLA